MPVYEYQGQHYEMSETDPSKAKEKIISHLGASEPKAEPQAKVSVEAAPATYGNNIPMQEPMGAPSATEGAGYGKSMQDIIQAASIRAKQTIPEIAQQGAKVISAPTQVAQQALPGVLPQGVVSMGMGLKDITNKLLERSVKGYESKLQEIPPLERMLGTALTDFGLPFAAQKAIPVASRAATALEEARAFTQTGAEKKAAKIAKEALGENLPAARKALEGAVDDITASQAMSSIDPKTGKPKLTAPTAQALLQMAQKKDPEFFVNLFGKQEEQRLKQLGAIAKGQDATAAKQAQEEMRKFTNERLIPTLSTELKSANIAGKLKPKFEKQAERMGGAAEQKVEDVRRFEAAKQRGIDIARQSLVEKGQPVGAVQYTYVGGDLPKLAEKVSQQSANASLPFGEASRFAKAASQSLEAHGLKPLESNKVVLSVASKLKDPSIAGNRDAEIALKRIGQDIQKWTDNNGVIDAFALDSIRKNSVNAVAKKLFANDPAGQKKFAGQITAKINPLIVDAIQEAGGTDYAKYLKDYAAASQEIAQTKAGAEALKLYQSSPSEFVKFVEGNSPETVERIFGAGKYDLAKEMSANASMRLEKVAGEVKSAEAASEQAKMGQERLKNVLEKNVSKFRIPGFGLFSAKKNAANSILEVLQERLDKKTMMYLTESAKSAKNFNQLINGLPIRERKRFEKVISDPETGNEIATMIGATEAQSKITKQEK